jgi:hypothetical protein
MHHLYVELPPHERRYAGIISERSITIHKEILDL